jgi:hypothetical protein
MIAWKFLRALALTPLLMLPFGPPASAQQYSVNSITTTDLGNIASAPTGGSIFQADPATGTVTRTSGSAVRLTAGSARSLVTVGCVGALLCPLTTVAIAITQTGTPTNRAGALQNFTVSTSGATASYALLGSPGTGNSINFTINAVPHNGTRTFWVGFDFPLSGDNGGSNSGISTANFAVTASTILGTQGGTLAGTATANVFRALSLTNQANLAFGRISRPRTGSGTVSLAATTGVVTTTGNGVVKLGSPVSSAAAFVASGEGGQSFSVSVPATFNLTNGANTIPVTLTPNVSGNQTLSGSLGSAGTLNIVVGGNFGLTSTTALGAYTGSFAVTVAYN